MATSTRFGFQKLVGSNTPLIPSYYDTFVDRVDANLPDTPSTFVAATTTVEIGTAVQTGGATKQTFTVTGESIAVTSGNGYGSADLVTFPDRNIVVIGLEADIDIVKGNTTNGIVAATDLDVAMGTAAASNTTLSGAMLNLLPKQDLDTNTTTAELAAHSLAGTPVLTGIADAASNTIYFNLVAIGGITADDTATITGTVDLYYFDLGNRTS